MTLVTRVLCSSLLAVSLGACHHQKNGTDGDGGKGDGGKGGDAGQVGPDLAVDDLRSHVNLSCPNGAHTTLTGTVYAPNGTLPLYNAAVYVPNGTVEGFTEGVTCDRCDGKLSGDPVAKVLTGSDGTFTLKDVPTGSNIPVVIQLGRWRRQITIPTVADCATTALTDPTVTRLPKNSSEGHMPHMAIATGKADPLECLFLKLGIDPAEITVPSGTGRIHFFRGTDASGLDTNPSAPTADTLYSSIDNLKQYDVVLVPCEGSEFDKSQIGGQPLATDPRALFQQYLDAGGRVFSTHFSYDWLTYTGSPYNKIAQTKGTDGRWPVRQKDDYNNTIATTLVNTFPKGMDFIAWLVAAGATSAPGTLDIIQGRSDLIDVDPTYAQAWATFDFSQDPNVNNGKKAVMHTTFNTPTDPPSDDMGQKLYCGRVVFSDFHATAGAVSDSSMPFPTACATGAMTDQEKALAFMLFDLSSCVQNDSTVPIL
jgi:hypothetical protein